jgi:hypothetical protein
LSNTFETIWEYKESFLSRKIDFLSFIGPSCPICGKPSCYRPITPYWRCAIDLFPEFKKERIPIARFVCRSRQRTFSALPTQLIPYHQYTVNAVIGALILGFQCRQRGQKGFHGASIAVDPESQLTPWLIACWLSAVVLGLRRAHGFLRGAYNLDKIHIAPATGAWQEAAGYLMSLGCMSQTRWGPVFQALVNRYSFSQRLFLLGSPSQCRRESAATIRP